MGIITDNEALQLLLTEVRVFGTKNGKHEKLYHYFSASVPRKGEYICVQYWECKVYHVEWLFVGKGRQPSADVYCDLSNTEL